MSIEWCCGHGLDWPLSVLTVSAPHHDLVWPTCLLLADVWDKLVLVSVQTGVARHWAADSSLTLGSVRHGLGW
jgi:hypothetical protein